MADAFIVRRGGGGGLSFSVVGGATQPTGKENLIWVNTSAAITSWVFSSTIPTSPTAGMVWFATGTHANAPINVVKKNGIYIYPTGCHQYVSGEWVSKTAKTYQNGAWVSWELALFKDGTASAESGGFTNSTIANNKLDVIPTPGAWRYCNSNNMIDVTSYRTLSVTVSRQYKSAGGDYSTTHFGLTSSKNVAVLNNFLAHKEVTETAETTYTLDISSVTGNAYFQLSARGAYDANNPNHITSIILS